MAWSRLQSAVGSSTGASTATATFGSNVSSGTKIVVALALGAGTAPTISSVQDGAANNWTQLAIKTSAAGFAVVALYALDTPAGDVGTKPAIKVTMPQTGDLAILVQEVSGLLAGNTTAMADGTPGTSTGNNGASTGSPSYTSTASNEYLTAVYGDDGGPETYTKPAALTDDTNSVNTSSTNDLSLSFGNSTNGTEAGSYALTGTAADWCVILGAFKLAAAGAVPGPALPLQAPQPPPPPPPPRSRIIPFLGALTGTAILTGSGTLAAAPFFSGAATLSGSGTLTATFTTAGTAPYVIQAPAQPPQPPRPPAAQLIGSAPTAAFTSGATLTGSGTLAAAPFFSAAATLSGSGTLTASFTTAGTAPYVIAPVTQPLQPARPPPGQIITAPSSTLLASAALTGSGTLTATPFFSAAATLSGSGTLTAAFTTAGTAPYVIVAIIQPPQPAQPPPGRLQPPPPPPPPLFTIGQLTAATAAQSALTAATAAGAASGGVLTASSTTTSMLTAATAP